MALPVCKIIKVYFFVIMTNLNPLFFQDLGSFSKFEIKYQLKSEIAKTYKLEIII